jgi:predicted nucleotidyltransferase
MVEKEVVKIINNYKKLLLANNCKVKRIFLFGSYAKGTSNSDSDIDIAVILEGLNNTQDELIKLMKFRRNIDDRIEPHPFDNKNFNTDNPFAKEILEKGIEII